MDIDLSTPKKKEKEKGQNIGDQMKGLAHKKHQIWQYAIL